MPLVSNPQSVQDEYGIYDLENLDIMDCFHVYDVLNALATNKEPNPEALATLKDQPWTLILSLHKDSSTYEKSIAIKAFDTYFTYTDDFKRYNPLMKRRLALESVYSENGLNHYRINICSKNDKISAINAACNLLNNARHNLNSNFFYEYNLMQQKAQAWAELLKFPDDKTIEKDMHNAALAIYRSNAYFKERGFEDKKDFLEHGHPVLVERYKNIVKVLNASEFEYKNITEEEFPENDRQRIMFDNFPKLLLSQATLIQKIEFIYNSNAYLNSMGHTSTGFILTCWGTRPQQTYTWILRDLGLENPIIIQQSCQVLNFFKKNADLNNASPAEKNEVEIAMNSLAYEGQSWINPYLLKYNGYKNIERANEENKKNGNANILNAYTTIFSVDSSQKQVLFAPIQWNDSQWINQPQ
ncbi:MAG: hypothetical protein WC748_03315 [Legionellales bacterium]|jgi:hypothetical protein